MPHTRRDRVLLLGAKAYAYPLWLGVHIAKAMPTMARDVERWTECVRVDAISLSTPYEQFARFTGSLPEFRSLVHYRIQAAPLVLRILLKLVYPGLATLDINTPNIGPGLFIQHGTSTIITAESIGANCWINQEVSIGWNPRGRPVVGDNVRLAAGAKIFGPIKIGDGATIGVNAIVIKDVPPGTVMVSPLAQPLESRETPLDDQV